MRPKSEPSVELPSGFANCVWLNVLKNLSAKFHTGVFRNRRDFVQRKIQIVDWRTAAQAFAWRCQYDPTGWEQRRYFR